MAELSHYEWQIPATEEATSVASMPHLILHFDMNKTLIPEDIQGQKTACDAICAEIAAQVVDCWDDSLPSPIDYAMYVKLHLLPNPHCSREVKLQQKAQMSTILQVLKERNHPDSTRMQQKHDQALELWSHQKTKVFTSFYKLIAFLHREHWPFTLVIRTFGAEAMEVAKELNAHFGDAFLVDSRTIKQGNMQGTELGLYACIANIDHHLMIRDDWHWWFEHNQNWRYGKPFPIDLSDKRHISLFFDDNAKPNPFLPEENIVCPYDALSNEPIAPDELIQKHRIFPVDMLAALCDEDYYIGLLQKALKE